MYENCILEIMFGRKKKQDDLKPDLSVYKKKLEVLNKNIDLTKLTSEIETFLKKSDDPFDYATYTIREFPEDKLKVFKIEYGIKSPTTKFFIALDGDSNNLIIADHPIRNYKAYAEILLVLQEFGLPKLFNAKAFYSKLWKFIEDTVKSLEN